jgi:hypothetical protein
MICALPGCTKKKDLSPPPLNPHPKEAVHIRVEFDNPEDARNYTLSMKALYQNQQEACGYIGNWWIGNFIYPNGEFVIPNESNDPRHGDFTIYLDRYNRDTCNWEFVMFGVDVTNLGNNWVANTDYGSDQLIPGTEFKDVCEFVDSDPNTCWQQPRSEKPSIVIKVPITTRVLRDSALPRPDEPGFFSHFLQPIDGTGNSGEGAVQKLH